MDEQTMLGRLRSGPWVGADLNDVFAQAEAVSTIPGSVADDINDSPQMASQYLRGLVNGDFRDAPPDQSSVVDDSTNKLPGWSWSPGSGVHTAKVVADSAYGSGNKFVVTSSAATSTTSYLAQDINIPVSQGQQYRALLSTWAVVATSISLTYQYLDSTGATIGSEVVTAAPGSNQECKVDAGLVPSGASRLRVRVKFVTSSATTLTLGEVRCAFLPAEATIGLDVLQGPLTAPNTQTSIGSVLVPANSLTTGSVYRITAFGTATGDGSAGRALTLRIRIGTTTLTGNIASSVAPTINAAASSQGFSVTGLLTIGNTGASGDAIGGLFVVGGPSQPFSANATVSSTTSSVAVNTTVANIIELTAVTAAAGAYADFYQCVIECVMAS